ncbi:sensor histidine kinase [Natronosalvus rutilus]|uniref:histidine kinase n=1 Tax=Natronosalvus rutilus TaxID=2953753 RepID=A0A9E7NEN0_9EURY|nr:histidine kinase N-terminal 7TM domain-containing protein [Natronosalvus rutilus]UTF55610.1 ATP-binding protein [Natronosalvus rutilus]
MFSTFGWQWQFTPFSAALLAAGFVTGSLASYAWRNRESAGAEAFAVLMGATSLWAGAYALQLAGANLATKVFWANVVHVGVAIVPVAWFCFALQFTGRDHWITRKTIVGLSVVPVIYVVLVWTNDVHRLVREPLGLEPRVDGSILIFRQEFGPAFDAHATYGYALMVAGLVVLVRLLFWSPAVYRQQVRLLLLGAVVPVVTNVLHHAGFNPITNFDPTPFSFTVAGVAFFFGIYHARLLDLSPVAREFVVDTLHEGVLVVDRNDRIVDVNASAQRLLEMDESTAVGSDLETVLPGTRLTDPDEGAETIEDELVLDGAVTRHLHCSSSPVTDVRGEALGRSIVVHDVTETRTLEANLAATVERLQRSNAELETFTSAVSHDLRAPLRTTDGYLSLLERQAGDALDPEDRELLAVARAHTNRLQGMIADVLAYSKIGNDDGDEQFEPVDCDRVLEQVIETLRFDVEERDGTVVVGELPTVWGVEHLLRRLFQNLVSNALTYSNGPPTIRVSATRACKCEYECTESDRGYTCDCDCDSPDHAYWDITVCDDGVGIEAGDLEYVFDLFTRADRSDSTSGTGMGLAICEKIVDYHSGSIAIDSTPDVGTTVTVRLPADRRSRKE